MQIYPPKSPLVSAFWREKYERDAMRNWDKFYKRNSNRFFKDRHYLDKEWGSYFANLESLGDGAVLEVGCGAGNTVFPLLAEYPHIFVYACDFSPRAIDIVKAHNDYSSDRVEAFVCDVTSEELTQHVPVASVDIVTMVFMLSAVSPERMPGVLQNIKKVLKPGGYLLFRDYATGDLAEERFSKKGHQQISDNFYVRGDGTRAFYFSEEYITKLAESEGFTVESLNTVCKVVENRAKELLMDRRWIQGVFRLKDEDDEGFGTEIFAEAPVVEEKEIEVGDYHVLAKSISRMHQHTCSNTGLMLWESAMAMSHLLLKHLGFLCNKAVLELGSGCVGICSLLASISSHTVLATDGDIQALDLLQQNIEANSSTFPVQKLTCKKLEWGNEEDISTILDDFPGGFDVVIGTDVTYMSEALPGLFYTAKMLLSRSNSVLLLCHLARRVGEAEIVAAAKRQGFALRSTWLSTETRVPDDLKEVFGTEFDTLPGSPVIFLWFIITE